MQTYTSLEHLPEEAIERYLLHHSAEAEIESVETHFIACETCIVRIEQMELQITATKLALQELHKEKVARNFAKHHAKLSWWSLSGLTAAGALAMAVVALSVLPSVHRDNSPAVNVQLTAYRGVESQLLPKDRALHITLNAQGLDGNLAGVSLVDSNGLEVWKNAVAIHNDSVILDIPKIHTTGTHFIRLYAPGKTESPLREFAVNVQ